MSYPIPQKRFIIPDLPKADDILPYLRKIDENRWYSNFGPLVSEFEARFAQTMAAAHGGEPAHCVTMTSGYHALSIGLRLLGVGAGSNVLIPAVTFPACPLAVQNLGGEAILCDVDPESWTLTPALARKAAAHTKIDAVMPVCLYGMAVPADEWDAFTLETGIPVIIDAAAAIETQRYPSRCLVAHSLHALKPFGVGEGGLLVTREEGLAARARQMTNFGTKDRITYHSGENAKMSEYHAAIALAQLDRWHAAKARRRDVYNAYKSALFACAPLAAPHPQLGNTIVSSLVVGLNGVDAPTLFHTLGVHGVAAHRTYLPPLYEHPHFAALRLVNAQGKTISPKENEDKKRHMKGAEHLNACAIGLPFHPFMSPQDVHEIVTVFSETLWQTSGCDYEISDNGLLAAYG